MTARQATLERQHVLECDRHAGPSPVLLTLAIFISRDSAAYTALRQIREPEPADARRPAPADVRPEPVVPPPSIRLIPSLVARVPTRVP